MNKNHQGIYFSTLFSLLFVGRWNIHLIVTFRSSLDFWCNFGYLFTLWSGIEVSLSKAYHFKGCFESTRGFQPYILSYLASTAKLVETTYLTIVCKYRLAPLLRLTLTYYLEEIIFTQALSSFLIVRHKTVFAFNLIIALLNIILELTYKINKVKKTFLYNSPLLFRVNL